MTLKIYINNEFSEEKWIFESDKEAEKTLTFDANVIVKIVKVSEAFTGLAKVVDLMTKPIEAVPKEEKIKVEFIGDSLTSGFGNNGMTNGITEVDWNKTWCSHLCDHFNWEAMVHSYSCMGLVQDSSGRRTNQISERRTRILGTDETTVFDFSTFPAKYVFILIGNNDFGFGISNQLRISFMKKMKEMIETIIQNYGNDIHIFLVDGPIMAKRHIELFHSIPTEFKDLNITISNISCELDFDDKKLIGCQNHPTEKGHQSMADQLIPQIEKILSN